MERRSHPRYTARDRVCVTLLPDAGNSSETETFYCTTEDLSANGLRFSSDVPFKSGQALSMLVVRGSAYWGFSLKGRVAWVEKTPQESRLLIGVEFTDVPRQARIAWQEAIERKW